MEDAEATREPRGSSRSGFLKQAAGAAAVVAGVSAGAGALAGPAEATLPHSLGTREWLELDYLGVGRLVDVTGGDPQFDVVIADYDADGNPDKLLGGLSHDREFTIEFGAGMSKPFYDWIHASFADPTVRKNGAIVSADYNYREVARRSFTNARITSLTIPRLVNRPQAFPAMRLTFSAETVSDDTPDPAATVSGGKQKPWLTSNFKFEIDGIPASRVSGIDSFYYQFEIVEQADGSSVVRGNPSDLNLVIDPAGVPAWEQWYDNFALGGDTSDERDATLKVWGSAPQDPLFTCTFGGLGIHTFIPESVIERTKVELYVETFTFGKGGA